MFDLFRYMEQNYEKFTNCEKIIAKYLLSQRKHLINVSAKEIGIATGTSAPTVVRFAKKLGFDSLNEMKLKLTISLENKKSTEKFEYLDKNMSTRSIINGIKNSFNNVIELTANLIKDDDLELAADIIFHANNVYIFGMGASGLVGLDFYYKMIRIGKVCVINNDMHLQIISSILSKDDDVVLAISYSGETKEVLSCVQNAKANGTKIISITRSSINNKLSNISDISLNVPYIEKSLREGAVSSRISQLAVIDMLYIGIARKNLNDVERKLVLTKNSIDNLKN